MEATQAAGWGGTCWHLLFSCHPCAAELWKWLLQDAWTDRGVCNSACFRSEEKRPPRREEDTTHSLMLLSYRGGQAGLSCCTCSLLVMLFRLCWCF